jgi:hypothetical protein
MLTNMIIIIQVIVPTTRTKNFASLVNSSLVLIIIPLCSDIMRYCPQLNNNESNNLNILSSYSGKGMEIKGRDIF